MLLFLIGSFPVVSAYFGIGNFEVPGTGSVDDADNDNIPDWWENLSWWNATCGLNYTDPTDNVSDFDGDGSINYWEYYDRTNPCLSNDDSDLDGIPDKWEEANDLNKFDSNDGLSDLDSDGLANYHEYLNDTNITNPDTDGDIMPDGWEVEYTLNPLNLSDAAGDLDGDGINNSQEYLDGTDPTKAPFTTTIPTINASVPESVDATEKADTTLELTATENLTDVSVNITKYTNISKNTDVNPLTSNFGLGPDQQSIGKGIEVSASDDLRMNLDWILIKMYYTDAELDRTGDGDADDADDIDPTSLRFWRFCPANREWQVLDKDKEPVVTCGSDNITVYNSSVDTTNKFVYAKLSNLSFFGVVGSILLCPITQKWCGVLGRCISLLDRCEAGGGPGGGGGGGAPPKTLAPIFTGGVVSLTPQLLIDLILRQKLEERTFWTVPNSVGASLVLTGEYPSPFSPIVRGALARPIRMLLEPLKLFRGERVESPEAIKDVYRFSTGRVLTRYPKSDVVIIAVRDPPVDSMAAVAYAKSINAPILLTERDDAPEVTVNALKQLNPKKIVIIGGPVAVSNDVESEFRKIAPTERIWGQTRYETAVEVAERLSPTIVVVTDGEAPSQDAVIVASEYKAPIIYVRGKEIPKTTKDFLVKHTGTKEGERMSWVTVGIDEDVHTEIQSIYELPEFMTKNRLTIKLYQLGTRFLR